MTPEKRAALEQAGFRCGGIQDFLGLTKEEVARIEKRHAEHLSESRDTVPEKSLPELFGMGVDLFANLRTQYEAWRQDVARAVVDYDGVTDQFFRDLFTHWADLRTILEPILEPILSRIHQECGSGVGELFAAFCETIRVAESLLADWTQPIKQLARGLHTRTLTEAEFRKLESWGKDGTGILKIEPKLL